MPLPEVSPTLGIKLGSLAAHALEYIGVNGHEYDKVAIEGILADFEVQDYLVHLDELGLLPKARS